MGKLTFSRYWFSTDAADDEFMVASADVDFGLLPKIHLPTQSQMHNEVNVEMPTLHPSTLDVFMYILLRQTAHQLLAAFSRGDSDYGVQSGGGGGLTSFSFLLCGTTFWGVGTCRSISYPEDH
jgi:hypothetical protein